jgi:hypothetical protein
MRSLLTDKRIAILICVFEILLTWPANVMFASQSVNLNFRAVIEAIFLAMSCYLLLFTRNVLALVFSCNRVNAIVKMMIIVRILFFIWRQPPLNGIGMVLLLLLMTKAGVDAVFGIRVLEIAEPRLKWLKYYCVLFVIRSIDMPISYFFVNYSTNLIARYTYILYDTTMGVILAYFILTLDTKKISAASATHRS